MSKLAEKWRSLPAVRFWSPDYIQHSAHIGILVEHWDVIQDETTEEQSKSKAPMFGRTFATYGN